MVDTGSRPTINSLQSAPPKSSKIFIATLLDSALELQGVSVGKCHDCMLTAGQKTEWRFQGELHVKDSTGGVGPVCGHTAAHGHVTLPWSRSMSPLANIMKYQEFLSPSDQRSMLEQFWTFTNHSIMFPKLISSRYFGRYYQKCSVFNSPPSPRPSINFIDSRYVEALTVVKAA